MPADTPPQERTISRGFTFACLSLAALAIVFILASPSLQTSTLVNALLMALFLSGPLAMKATGSRAKAVAFVFSWFALGLAYFGWESEGLGTGIGGWFILTTVAASFLGGTRAALRVGVLVTALSLLAAYGEITGLAPLRPLPADVKAFSAALSTCTSTAFCALFAALYARARAQNEAEVARALGELGEERARLAAVIESTEAAILTFDADGRSAACNTAAQALLDALAFEQPERWSIVELIPGEGWRSRCQQALEGRRSRFEQRLTIGQESRFFEISLAPQTDGGATTGVVLLAADITERRAAEARVASLNRRLIEASRQAGMAEVATGVLHNVGNVLNSVNVSAALAAERARAMKVDGPGRAAELLRAGAEDAATLEKVADYLDRLGDALAEERRIVLDELAQQSRNIEHIKVVVARQQSSARLAVNLQEEVSPSEIVEDALRLNQAAIQEQGITLVRDFQEVPALLAQRHRILEILVNLVSNACQAFPGQGSQDRRLLVRVSAERAKARFQVEDTGVGIPAENLTRIFGHGFTTKASGHGFGLHASALSAREMGGELTAQSDGPGKGATFTLELPLNAEDARVARCA